MRRWRWLLSLFVVILISSGICQGQTQMEELDLVGPVKSLSYPSKEDKKPYVITFYKDGMSYSEHPKGAQHWEIRDEKGRELWSKDVDPALDEGEIEWKSEYDEKAKTYKSWKITPTETYIRSVGTLNAQGQIVKKQFVRFPEMKWIYEYDLEGRMKESIMWDDTKIYLCRKSEYFYGTSRKEDSIKGYFWNSRLNDWEIDFEDRYEYDENERIRERVRIRYVKNEQISSNRETILYQDFDSHGNWTKRTTKSEGKAPQIKVREITYYE